MAATNYTPIQLYHSTTASAAPTAGNLVNGELAINILDGKLYYKDNGGTVQIIASKGTGTIGGSTTQVQYNLSGALAGSSNFTFNGTTATINTLNLTNALGAAYGGTAQSTYAQGDLLYASAANTLAKLPIGINTYILTSNGTIPGWSIPSSVVIGTATNLAGGAAGSVPYQSGAGATTFLSIGTANQVVTSTGSAPQWSSALTLTGLSNSGLTTLDKTVTVGNTSFNGAAVFAPATPAKVYLGTGTVTDVTSAIAATNAAGAIVALGVTPIAATNANVTYTNASTLYIAGAPSAGTNITITNPYALYVAAGDAYFGGTVTAGTVNLTTLDLTNLEVTNIKAKDGTASMTLADSTGVVTFSANPVLNAGTANGVPYLSSPGKVLTTGSALTFDGTNFALTGKFSVSQNSVGLAAEFTNADATNGYGVSIAAGGTSATRYALVVRNPASTQDYFKISTVTGEVGHSIFAPGAPGSSEIARFTTTGLGIGTNNPAYKLDVAGSGASTLFRINNATTGKAAMSFANNGTVAGAVALSGWWEGDSSNDLSLIAETGYGLRFYTNGSPTEKAVIDTSGNLGLGVTPSAWSGYTALQVGSGFTAWSSGVANARINANTYYNGGYKYVGTGTATMYEQDGYHAWYNAPSGTANSAVVAASKSYTVVALGTTTLAQWQASFNDASNNPLTVTPTLGQVLTSLSSPVSPIPNGGLVTQNISFTQAMTLDASGNLQLATTTSSNRTITVGGTGASIALAGSNGGIYFGAAGTPAGSGGFGENAAIARAGNTNFHITGSVAGDLCIAAEGTKSILFGTSSSSGSTSERARITSGGDFGLGVTSTNQSGAGSARVLTIGGTSQAFTEYVGTTGSGLATGSLHRNASALVGGIVVENATGNQGIIEFSTNNGTTYAEKARISSDGTFRVKGAGTAGTTDAVQFSGSAPASAMTLDASGNLGVGATSPSNGVEVAVGSKATAGILVTGNNSPRIVITETSGTVTGGIVADAAAIYLGTSTNHPTVLRTNGTEKARITSGGYFKASDTGSYIDPATFHEFTQTANSEGLQVRATNASYSNNVLQVRASRNTTNNSYYLISCYNDGGANYRLRVADSGSISTAGSIQLGDAGAPPTSGVGVKFPATQSASSDANTLDDYEEGEYDVTMSTSASGSITLVAGENRFSYTKIGRQVTVTGAIQIDSVSSPVGFFNISLPFAIADLTEAAGRGSASVVVVNVVSANVADFLPISIEGESNLRVYLGDGTNIQDDSAQQLQATSGIYVTFTYFA